MAAAQWRNQTISLLRLCPHTSLASGGLDAYVAVPSKPYTAAVVLFTDIFGYKTDNIRRWADKLADAVSQGLQGFCSSACCATRIWRCTQQHSTHTTDPNCCQCLTQHRHT